MVGGQTVNEVIIDVLYLVRGAGGRNVPCDPDAWEDDQMRD